MHVNSHNIDHDLTNDDVDDYEARKCEHKTIVTDQIIY